jgi:2-C-methyl-D-erythritol 2,4-cyclodiphosphate synthase
MMKIGHGFDVHKLVSKEEFLKIFPTRKNHKFVLGSIEIPYEKVLLGHSDADVLIHAIIDSLLGASGNTDIGTQFPDNDPSFEGIESSLLLKRTLGLLKRDSWDIVNIDCTVLAERPKLKDYIIKMRSALADLMGLRLDQINIKATTTEGLGFLGREEGIAVTALCLISSDS